MINKKDIFKVEYIDVVAPYSFEFLNILIGQLGFSQNQYDNPEVKITVLNVLKHMFELDIIYVKDWMNNSLIDDHDMSIDEIINKIDMLWHDNMEFPDFYGIGYFETKEWYVNKMEDLGMTVTTDWKTFVDENIGDLKKWIENNRP